MIPILSAYTSSVHPPTIPGQKMSGQTEVGIYIVDYIKLLRLTNYDNKLLSPSPIPRF